MGARIIDGKSYAEALGAGISNAVSGFSKRAGRAPGLAVILVGSDPASEIYVRSKVRMAARLGMRSFEHVLAADTRQESILDLVARLNADELVDGILVQLPLPAHVSELAVIEAINPAKDVDGLHPLNAGRLLAGIPGHISCTPLGCMMLLKHWVGDLSGLDAIVIGRSILVGKPMAQLLLAANCTVTMAHSRTRDLPLKVRQADIVVAATGRPEMIKGDWLKPDAIVIDVGTTRVASNGVNRLVGDVDFGAALDRAGAITPVPGGVGPMTIMSLMHNTLASACSRSGFDPPVLW